MKRKALARAVALALCLMLCVPAMATSWGLTEQTSSAVAAGALYAGEEAALKRKSSIWRARRSKISAAR